MRRIRTPGAGETVILAPTRRRSAGRARGLLTISLEVPRQFAVDLDVRKLLDRIRVELGDALRGDANPDLAKRYSLGPISGNAARATATLTNTSRTAARYFAAVFPKIAPPIVERVTAEWLLQAVPPSGDGVGTPATVNTSSGPLPR